MPTSLRTLGVHGKNAPTRQTKTVQAADFAIAGIIGLFERRFAQAILVNNPIEEQEVFGGFVDSTTYAKDVTKALWNNLGGNPGKLYIKSHVGYNGSAIDAVVASKDCTDQNGLISAITRANAIKKAMNAHAADAAIHAHADATNFPITAANAQDLSTLVTLVNAIITAYKAHEADAALASAWAFHIAQETGTHALASTTPVTDLATALTMMNDMHTKFNAHDADASAHNTANQHQDASSAPSSTPANTLKVQAAWKTILEYGTSGNRTGISITSGIRYTTTLAASMLTTDITATLTSVIGIAVGDIVTFNGTGGTAGVKNVKVTVVNESTNVITWVGAIGITGTAGDVVDVPGFKIRTWRKSITGIIQEVATDLGIIWCTMEPEVTAYYFANVHQQNPYIYLTSDSSASTNIEHFPTEILASAPGFMTSGANGTTPTTSTHWDYNNSSFDGLPIRLIANCETGDVTTQKDLETYCRARNDTPIVVARLAENQTKAQLLVIGSGYQRSNDVYQVNVADWVGVSDPYNTSPNAPDRKVPSVGHVMGAWLQSIAVAGIHVIPCTDQIAIVGINSLDNSNLGLVGDQDRTDLATYGINIIQFVNGSGYRIRNLFTPSTALAYMFANGIMMRNFLKVSASDSLQSSENTPNSFNRIKEDKSAILSFMYRLWFVGSTGNVPAGETFGQQQNTDGSLTIFDDHVQVVADPVNNPLTLINLGQRNIQVYFTYPAPAGSIDISVGILLR